MRNGRFGFRIRLPSSSWFRSWNQFSDECCTGSAKFVQPIENLDEISEQAFLSESKENRCGRQDHWASAYGGFNHLLFIGDSVERMPFEPMKSSLNWLKRHLVIAYSGSSRNSGEIQESVWSSYSNGVEEVIQGLHKIRSSAREMADGLQQDRRDLVVSSLRGVCEGVDMIDPTIHDPFRGVSCLLLSQDRLWLGRR